MRLLTKLNVCKVEPPGWACSGGRLRQEYRTVSRADGHIGGGFLAMAAPRTVGPIAKEAGGSSGIGLQQDVGREGHCIIAYINDDSMFNGLLKVNDEILEINGVKATHAKQASEAILAAGPELTLIVCPRRRHTHRVRYVHLTIINLLSTGANARPDDPNHHGQEEIGPRSLLTSTAMLAAGSTA